MRSAILLLAVAGATARAQGAIAGVVTESGRPVDGVTVLAERSDRGLRRETVTDSIGRFHIAPLAAGVYTVTARRVGFRSAELPGVRVPEAGTVRLNVLLTQAPRQLSSIEIVSTPTSIDASTPALTLRLDRAYTELLPTARDASSLIALVPGARKDQLWGGAPGVSNDYQLDGVSMNHPGIGGDLLSVSVDWIDALEITGLGAGAEHGNFQGGVINAITRTGGNELRYRIRANLESARLTATNLNANEQGVEQAGRREVSGEAGGPLARDRLFYFVGGQYVDRQMRSPDLTTEAPHDFQRARETHLDARGIAKVTWLPALGQRVDLLGGFSANDADRFGINGVDDPSATLRVRQPTSYYALSWTNAASARSVLSLRLAGFAASTSLGGYEGPAVPGAQVLRLGRMPAFQNAAFDELRKPSSVAGTLEWRSTQRALGAEHQLVLGSEVMRGRWRDDRTRNGGLTWRPYTNNAPKFDPMDAKTWVTVGSDWGGEIRLDSDMGSEALFAQDYMSLGARVTVTPGLRYGHWSGFIRPDCTRDAVPATSLSVTPCYRFEAVHDEGFDPRIGVAWDVTGRNTFAVKAHWGRYHQGMFSLFFDRAAGANVYSNSRFYYTAPPITDSRTTFTPAQRDAPSSGFSTFYDENILDESGRVEGYKQPYVDQIVFSVEKTFGPSWKTELIYTNRVNRNIVGLKDRNLWQNYSPIRLVSVKQRLFGGDVLDEYGKPLVLPVVYVANDALRSYLIVLSKGRNPQAQIGGYGAAMIDRLTWNPDVVLTAIPEARRRYDQITLTLKSYHERWRGEGSVTGARLRGNVPGVTGFGTAGTRFSAGPFVRPNEAINAYGFLPDALEMEGKLWLTARLPASITAGVLYTHILGERFSPQYQLLGRYDYRAWDGNLIAEELLKRVLGQTILLEPRGARQYASRDVVDAHIEWRPRGRTAVLLLDLFNVFGANALTRINENVGDQSPTDPSSFYGAARLRVAPRTLRVGLAIE